MKKTIHFNQTADNGGASTEELSDADITNLLNSDSPAAEDTSLIAVVQDDVPAQETPATDVENPAEIPAEVKETPAAAVTEEVVADEDKLAIPPLVEGAEDANWLDFGKVVGIEVAEDSYEAVIKAIPEKLNAEYERGKAEGAASVQTVDLEKFAPESRSVINALQTGMKLEDILVPLQGYNEALAMPPETRLTEYYTKVLKMTPDQAADQIAVITENGTITAVDAQLQVSLKSARDAEFKGIISKGEAEYAAIQAANKARTEKENNDVRAAIVSRKEFMGAEVSADHHAALIKNWETGTYKKLMAEDPQAVADFVYWKEFGKQRAEQLVARTKKETKLEVVKNLANTPKTATGTKATPQQGTVDANEEHSDEEIQQMLNKSKGIEYAHK